MGVSRSTFYHYLKKHGVDWRSEVAVEETSWPPKPVRRIVSWTPITAGHALTDVEDLSRVLSLLNGRVP
jgi:hypothetical protein